MLDVNLPDGDGIALAGELTRDAAVVIVSTLDETASATACSAPARADSCPKPISHRRVW